MSLAGFDTNSTPLRTLFPLPVSLIHLADPFEIIRQIINAGEVEILFRSYQSDPRPVYALYTEKDKLPLKVQVCIDYLTDYFKRVSKVYQGYRQGKKGTQWS